ncbi:hypothetical protein WJX81_007365 [Elliptochloris bilobata]|uniref:Complex 1 LYR protein domain-containing protein n=1 Tax=Elliptochloris bilobata TaxID=381761 RepID=A0AAW1SCL3_9CHLO
MLTVPLLYRKILRAAKLFPSIKRNAIIADIKVEFREGQAVSDPAEVKRRRALALQSLGQLEDYAGLARSESKDIDIFLKGPDVGRQ